MMSAASKMSALLRKSFWQQLRDPMGLLLTLLTAPVFVVLYRLLYRSSEAVPFEHFVPSLLVFAVIMLIFSTAMQLSREAENGTLERLRVTPMRPVHYLGAASVWQGVLGTMSVGLTFVVALALGFESAGSVPLAFVVTTVAALASIGLGVLVASLAKSVSQAFLIASVCMFLLLLFSGAVFPLPELSNVEVMGAELGLLDVLPTVHAVRALREVLLEGRPASVIGFELAAMGFLSSSFFALGWWRFTRRQGNALLRGRR
jgi:ABC-type multidrug transport system permease subunit